MKQLSKSEAIKLVDSLTMGVTKEQAFQLSETIAEMGGIIAFCEKNGIAGVYYSDGVFCSSVLEERLFNLMY